MDSLSRQQIIKTKQSKDRVLSDKYYEPPIDEREHDPYVLESVDDLDIPEIEYVEPEIPSDEEMAYLEGRDEGVSSVVNDELLAETGELEPFDRKDKRLFIDGVPIKVVTNNSGDVRYNVSLSLANDKMDPLFAYVKPKLNTANQWYGQNEMDRIANVTHVPVDYVMEDFDKKALSGDLVRNDEGEYRLNTRSLEGVDDFDYERHVEVTHETQSLYELWSNALSATSKALTTTAKDVLFRAYQLKERYRNWRQDLQNEYDEWQLHQENKSRTKLKDKVLNLKEDLSAWSRGRDDSQGFKSRTNRYKETKTKSQFMSKLEVLYWNRAQKLADKLGFTSKKIVANEKLQEQNREDLNLDL